MKEPVLTIEFSISSFGFVFWLFGMSLGGDEKLGRYIAFLGFARKRKLSRHLLWISLRGGRIVVKDIFWIKVNR